MLKNKLFGSTCMSSADKQIISTDRSMENSNDLHDPNDECRFKFSPGQMNDLKIIHGHKDEKVARDIIDCEKFSY